MVNESILAQMESINSLDFRVVSSSIPADLETPVSAYIKLRDNCAKFLLESVESGTNVGRYSFIGMEPESKVIINSDSFHIIKEADDLIIPFTPKDSPLDIMKEYLNRQRLATPFHQPRLLGGAVGYMSYDFVRFFEKMADVSKEDLNLPLAMFHMIDTLLVFDHVKRRINILSLTDQATDDAAMEKINNIKDTLNSTLIMPLKSKTNLSSEEPVSNFTKDEFCAAVLKVKEHIVAGDVYQQVISQRLEGTTEADPFNVYRSLRMLNPSPYMYFLDFNDMILIGSSPEAMVRLEDGQATVRPIAGTRPRGITDEEEKEFEQDLITDEKERAEHIMLVDLGRNDLGKCCEVGTVKVNDFMNIEKYSHVMHITSNVIGKLRSDLDQFDLFRATFPAGTVSGAPKLRAMQLIEEMEGCRRGPYAGAVGYFSLTGDSDWCINIRTIVMKDKTYYLQAGAGIVADSVPENEYIETKNKIAALKKAIENAEKELG